MKPDFTPGRELLFLALGGSGEIGMNVNLYGADGKWLMVDLGMTFSGGEYPGVDLVFPDLQFIEERVRDLVGIVLTHAHEDHIGAVPYFAEELNVPIYATPFTAELVARKLNEAGIADEVDLVIVDELQKPLELGPFTVRYVPLAHSIAEGNALLIDTPYGRVFHTGDWKLDEEPIVGEPTTEAELRQLGAEGILALVCDSTNVFNPSPSGSEGAVREGLLEEVARYPDARILVTTFASNVARLQILGEVAAATGRQICIAGRSIERMLQVAQGTGYLGNFPEPIGFDAAMTLPRGEVLILATGGQGEPRAALSRIAEGTHPLALEADDVVLFSSRQIPGNELAIGRVQNALARRGVRMVTGGRNLIHVSGHPGRPELEALYDWLQPDILVPVHGEFRHMAEQFRLGSESGIPHSVLQKNGDIVKLAPGRPRKLTEIATGRLVLDGDLIVPADGEAIAMRRRLAQNGIVFVVLRGDGEIDIAVEGLPLDEDEQDFVEEARGDIVKALRRLDKGARRQPKARSEAARLAVRRAATRWSGKRPQVRVVEHGS